MLYGFYPERLFNALPINKTHSDVGVDILWIIFHH